MEEWIVIILAVISIIAGSKGNKKRAAEPTEESLEGGFEELLRELGADQPEQKRVEVKPTPVPTPKPTIEHTSPSAQYRPMQVPVEGREYKQATTRSQSSSKPTPRRSAAMSRTTAKAKTKTKPIAPPEEPANNNEAQFEDINLRDMVIYDAILNPKHSEY